MALLGRAYSSQELCGVPGIADVEAHVRHALDDHLRLYSAHLNGRYDLALTDLLTTAITRIIPSYDVARANGLSVSTFTYRKLRQRYIIQWYRDNIKDTRYGRHCPDCSDEKNRLRGRIVRLRREGKDVARLQQALAGFRVTDTKWAGNDQRECRRCGLLYDDYTEVPLSDNDRRDLAIQCDFTAPEVYDLVNGATLSPTSKLAMRYVVKPMVEVGLTQSEAVKAYASTAGCKPRDVIVMLRHLREEIAPILKAAA